MIPIDPEIIDIAETWVREKGDRSLQVVNTEGIGWEMILRVHAMHVDGYVQNLYVSIPLDSPWALDRVTRHTQPDSRLNELHGVLRYPTSQEHLDWLYDWPSHRIERSRSLMLHMLDHHIPWTSRYTHD